MGMVFSQLLGYINTILTLRFVDVSSYGTIVFLESLLGVAVILSIQGMQIAASKFISEFIGKGDRPRAINIFNDSKWFIMISAILLTSLSPLIYRLLPPKITDHVDFSLFLLFFIPFIIAVPLTTLNQFGFLGLKLAFLSSLSGYFLQPAFRAVCVLSILTFLPTVTGLVYTQVIPFVLAYLISEILINKYELGNISRQYH